MDPALFLLAFGSAACFALALALTQFGLKALPPLNGAAISIPTTATMFLALAPFTVDFGGWQGESALLFALAGVFFPVSVTLLTFLANARIGPNLTGAIGNLTPLFAVALGAVWLGETPTGGQWTAIGIVCLGVVLLFAGRRGTSMAAPAWAFALPLAAAFVRGVTQPMVKSGLAGWPDPFAAVTIGYAVSAVVVLAVFRLRGGRRPGPAVRGWPWFVVVGVTNGCAVFLLYAALRLGPITIIAPLVACYPLLTLIFQRLLTGKGEFSPPVLGGIGLTVFGVVLLLAA